MKNGIKCFLIFIYYTSFVYQANGQDVDSLSKYSYFLFAPTKDIGINEAGQKQNKSKMATVFFIRKNKRLYLVSAAHSILGLDYNNKFEKDFPDTFYLRLYKQNSTEMFDLKFSVTQLKSGIDTNFYKSHYDIIFYQMNLPEFDVKSIENFIDIGDTLYNKIVEAAVYGFASSDGGDLTKSTIDYRSLTKINLNSNFNFYNSFSIKSGKPSNGFSGSPLFLKTADSRIIFGGVSVAGNDKVLTFVPPKTIIEILNKL